MWELGIFHVSAFFSRCGFFLHVIKNQVWGFRLPIRKICIKSCSKDLSSDHQICLRNLDSLGSTGKKNTHLPWEDVVFSCGRSWSWLSFEVCCMVWIPLEKCWQTCCDNIIIIHDLHLLWIPKIARHFHASPYRTTSVYHLGCPRISCNADANVKESTTIEFGTKHLLPCRLFFFGGGARLASISFLMIWKIRVIQVKNPWQHW